MLGAAASDAATASSERRVALDATGLAHSRRAECNSALPRAAVHGLWSEFHLWSIPMLAIAILLGLLMIAVRSG
jgi:hypothetical protein